MSVSAPPWHRRPALVNPALLAMAVAWLALVGATLTPRVNDFPQYWQAATNIRTSGDPYATMPEPGEASAQGAPLPAYPNPPLLAYLMLPFASLPMLAALQVWFGLNIAMLAGYIALCLRMCGAALARRWWGVVVLLALLAPPTRLGLQLGQVSILLALLAALAYWLRERRGWLAGLCVALGALIKLYPGFLGLAFLRWGPRRTAWRALVSGASVAALAALLHGPGPYSSYLRKVLLGGFYPYAAEFNISLTGFFQRLLVPSRFALPLADAPWLAAALTLVGALVVLGGWALAGGPATDETAGLLRYGATICAMLLIAPVNGSYNLVALLIPALAGVRALEEAPDRGLRAGLILGIALACVPPGWSGGTPLYEPVHTGWGLLALSPALYGLAIVFVTMVLMARRAGRR